MEKIDPGSNHHYESFTGANSEQDDNQPEGLSAADIQEIEDYANENGLSEEDAAATIADLEQRKKPEESEELLDQPSAIAEDIESITERLDGIEAGLGNAIRELYELQDTLSNFFRELAGLLKELERYLNKIANTTDPDEKKRLTAELQAKINSFGR